MNRIPARIALASTALLLAACSDGGERESLLTTIGLRQTAPDEFMVVERRPLTMPGDLTALPTPVPGAPNRVDPRPQQETIVALTGQDPDTMYSADTAGRSAGEDALVTALGADVDPTARDSLAAEQAELRGQRPYGLRTVFGRPTFDPNASELLDPEEETRRLQAQGLRTPSAPQAPEPTEEEERQNSGLSIRIF
ncbi:MAG: DUF3035 domain-containing protein [Pseudomonadota bacterium]